MLDNTSHYVSGSFIQLDNTQKKVLAGHLKVQY
jgi:hypothetical protein